MGRIWSESEVHELIRQWRTLPQLWDIENPCYRDKAQKRKATLFLAELFNTTESEVFKKMYALRAQFIEHRSDWVLRRVYSVTTAAPTWEYYDEMKFVYNNGREVRSAEDSLVSPPITEISCKTKTPQQKKYGASLPKKHTSKRRSPTVQDTLKPMDASQVFGSFIATELKNLKNKENRKLLKRFIQRAIEKYTDLAKSEEANEDQELTEDQQYVVVEDPLMYLTMDKEDELE